MGTLLPPTSLATMIVRQASAKINLFLEVRKRRPDGFHEIATLMLAIDLADELRFFATDDDQLTLTCDVPELDTGPANLIAKAAARLRQETGCRAGARIELTKRIPWAAGLGGGSSNAAATLTGLNELWQLGLSMSDLSRLAAELGSDVPFFLNGPAAWCTGRGEIIEPVPVGRAFDFVLVKPDIGLSTAEVYGRLKLPQTPRNGDEARAALASGDAESLGRALHNRLQEPAFAMSSEVSDWVERLRAFQPAGVLMSGSGSCVFALFPNTSAARQAHDGLASGLAAEDPSTTRVYLVRSRH